MPLFVDAYLSSTINLTLEESGAYLHLLMAAWKLPHGALPDSDTDLARWAKCSLKKWLKLKPRVITPFWHLTADGWVQKRLRKELAFVRHEEGDEGQEVRPDLARGTARAASVSCRSQAVHRPPPWIEEQAQPRSRLSLHRVPSRGPERVLALRVDLGPIPPAGTGSAEQLAVIRRERDHPRAVTP